MRLALKIGVGLVLIVGVMVSLVWNVPEIQEELEFGKRFESVQIGDTEEKVLSVLGAPHAKENEFRIGQKEGFEDAYVRAAASDSNYYLLWFKGIDVIFAVGINNEGKVSVKELGGT